MSRSFAETNVQLSSELNRLDTYLQTVPASLRMVSEDELAARIPGKWSRKEILGHLIDSAVNNLKRFTDAQASEERYTVIPYQQNQLVTVNQYQDLPLPHLIGLWQVLNQQIVYVARAIPANKLERAVILPDGQQTTLSFIIEDYVAHMEHHFKTLL